MNPVWYVRRLAAMSADEVAFRIGFTLTKKKWRRRSLAGRLFAAAAGPIAAHNTAGNPFAPGAIEKSGAEACALVEEANAALRHEWRFFGLSGVSEKNIDWHLDPVSGIRAPSIFSYDIDHRDASAVGDPKIIWEKNRHHHLTVLAAAYAITKNERYAQEVANQLIGWIADNPCLIGINWGHPLELGIRLISWVWVERLLRGSVHYNTLFGPQSPVWPSIGMHQKVISRAFSRGSSANNHLIGEMAGLFIASVAFPCFRFSTRFAKLSHKILEREVSRQTFPSGINRELAFGYQLFAAEFLLLAVFEGERVGISFSSHYRSLLARMIEAIPPLTDIGGNLPRYGDSDDGMALQLHPNTASRTSWLFQLASVLLKIGNHAGNEPGLQVLLMGVSRITAEKSSRPLPSRIGFKDAGIYVMSVDRGTPSELFVLADAGPLGYGKMAAHGHADALSFTLSVGGKPIFIDPGTYSYYTDKATRDYFRGTRAHDTLTVDDRNQSVAAGMFLWSSAAATTVSLWNEDPATPPELTARHNGYAASLGIIHCRNIALSPRAVTIRDMIYGSGDHGIRIAFHCAPECEIEKESNSMVMVRAGSTIVRMAFDDRLEMTPHRADQAGGWYSPRYGIKVATYTLFASAQLTLPVTLTTTIEVLNER